MKKMRFKSIYALFLFYILTIDGINAEKRKFLDMEFESTSGSCSQNEIFSTCGSDCGKTCDDIERKGIACKKVCSRGCFCEIGYYRDFKQNGRCVRSHECKSTTIRIYSHFLFPKKLCLINEEYTCGTECGKQCEDIGKNIWCPKSCESGCYCKSGYFRDRRWGGNCVKEKICAKKVNKKISKDKLFFKWLGKKFESPRN